VLLEMGRFTQFMPKMSSRCMYALGALVIGIVLLYVCMCTVEGFADEKPTVSVYLNLDKSLSTDYYSTDKDNKYIKKNKDAILIKGSKCTIEFIKPFTVKKYTIYQYSTDCNAKKLNSTTKACWTNISAQNPIIINNENGTIPINNTKTYEKINVDLYTSKFGKLYNTNTNDVGNNEKTDAPPPHDAVPSKFPTPSNIRIDLVLI